MAEHLGVPPSFVAKMASGERPVPPEHGAAIESFTNGAFSRREYWPDKHTRIWPDLADTQQNLTPPPVDQAQGAMGSEQQGAARQGVARG